MPKVWQNAVFFGLLGLALSEKQIPQVNENTEEGKSLLEPLESVGRRPRQARYQATLRPDGNRATIIRHLSTRMLPSWQAAERLPGTVIPSDAVRFRQYGAPRIREGAGARNLLFRNRMRRSRFLAALGSSE